MQILVSNVQFIFGTLDKPTKYSEESTPKFYGKFLVTDEDTINTIKAAIEKTAKDKFNTVPKKLTKFIFEPDLDKYPEQEGSIVFNASQQDKPNLFNRQGEMIEASEGKIYRGCFVNVLISLWGYTYKGSKGISANLKGIQFFAKGTPLGNTASAADFENYGPETQDVHSEPYETKNEHYEVYEDQFSPLG